MLPRNPAPKFVNREVASFAPVFASPAPDAINAPWAAPVIAPFAAAPSAFLRLYFSLFQICDTDDSRKPAIPPAIPPIIPPAIILGTSPVGST